jgi:hypothetical protein
LIDRSLLVGNLVHLSSKSNKLPGHIFSFSSFVFEMEGIWCKDNKNAHGLAFNMECRT